MTIPTASDAVRGTPQPGRLDGCDPRAALPRDRAVSDDGPPVAARLGEPLDPAVLDRFLRSAGSVGHDPFAAMLAAFLALLFRQTGRADLVVDADGAPSGTADGDPIPVHVAIPDGGSFADLLAMVRSRIAEFPGATRGTTTPMPVAFAWNTPATEFPPHTALGLRITLAAGSPRLLWTYDSRRFQRGYIAWMSRHLAVLLERVGEETGSPLGDIPLASAEEEALLRRWSAGPTPTAEPGFHHARFRIQAERTPDAIAVVHGGERVTFGELERRANRLAHHLQTLGVGPDVVVGLCLERSVDLVAATLAATKAGGGVLLLDPESPPERRALLLEWARPALVVGRRRFATPAAGNPTHWVHPEEMVAELAALPASPPPNRATAASVAFVFATSGSTGRPKLVVQPYGVFRAPPVWDSTERHLLKSSSGTTFTTFEILSLISGGTLYVVPEGDERDLERLASYIGEFGITNLLLAPGALSALLALGDLSSCRGLGTVVCIGETIAPELKKRFRERLAARLMVGYGCTEARGATSRICGPDDDPALVDSGTTGTGMETWVTDTRDRLAPVGIAGEILVGGQIARGYLDDPDETARRFVRHPFGAAPDARVFRTGDLGRWLPDGTLEVLGRLDHQIKIRGYRIEPAEIEAAIAAYPGVRECVVVARGTDPSDQRLVAYVASSSGAGGADRRGLRGFLSQRLPEPMVPGTYVEIDRLPLTANGKVDRAALPAPRAGGRDEPAGSAPSTPAEIEIARAWMELLPGSNPGKDDDFFALGGHSLLAVRMLGLVRDALGKDIPLRVLFRNPTIAGLARAAESAPTTVPDHCGSLRVIRGTGRRPPLFVFPGGNGGDRELYVHAHLAEFHLGPDQPVYGLRRRGWDGKAEPHADLASMVGDYLAEIRAVRPRGPYLLLGDCIGANVAFHVACRMRAEGDEVAWLAMADGVLPRAGDYARYWTRSRWRRLRQSFAGRVVFNLPRLAAVATPGGREWLRAKLEGQRQRLEETETGCAPEPEYWTPEGEHYLRLATTRAPGRFDGRVHLLLSEGNADDPLFREWQRHAAGGIEVHCLPGNHWEYLWQGAPKVAELVARHVDRAMDVAGGQGSGPL